MKASPTSDSRTPEGPDGVSGGRLGLLVVVIDDAPSMVDFYKSVIRRPGVVVEGETDAVTGLEMVYKLHPDLVILDLAVPGLTGLEALRRIKRWNSLTRVVMVTSHYSIETAIEALREGAADYICEPVPPQKLRELVEQAQRLANS